MVNQSKPYVLFIAEIIYKNVAQIKLQYPNIKNEATGNKIPEETIKLLNIQKNAMIEQLIKIPNLYDAKNNNLLKLSTKAYKLIFRMCESYELWCKETNQSQLIQLDVLD